MKQAKAPIQEALAKISLIEDLRIDKVDLGERPFRVDSFKTYETREDEIIIETPAFWGGDLRLRLTAVVKLGPLRIDAPVDIADIQLKALMRITMRPLVETLPCVGGVTLSLLEEPQVNFTLKLLDSPDIMCLFGVPLAIKAATSIVASRMFVYPNEFTVPLMPNYGLPYPPVGMITVKAVSGHDLKSSFFDKVDPFIVLEVRPGRTVQTNVIQNEQNPVWNETLDLVVDDPRKQNLKVMVYDYDIISPDVVGGICIDMMCEEIIQHPRKSIKLRIPVYSPSKKGEFPVARSEDVAAAVRAAATDDAVVQAISTVPKRRGLIGKLWQKRQAKKAVAAALDAMEHSNNPPTSLSKSNSAVDGGSEALAPASPSASSAAGGGVFDTPRNRSKGSLIHSVGNNNGDDDDNTIDDDENDDGVSSTRRGRGHRRPLMMAGSVTLEVTYFPFKDAKLPPLPEEEAPSTAAAAAVEQGGAAAGTAAASSSSSASVAPPLPAPAAAASSKTKPSKGIPTTLRRTLQSFHSLSGRPEKVKGILTVNLKKVMHLGSSVNSYVQLKLYDPHKAPIPDIIIKTKVEINEASPRFNFKTDFVNISAASVLIATVYSQPGLFDALTSLKVPFLQQASPPMLGKVRVPLNNVVTEGRVKDVYPLQDAETGEMHLTLEWTAIDIDVDEE